jgi:hypothetical protein
VPDLVLVFLLVSSLSLASQAAALARLSARRPGTRAEALAGRGYIRTVACRVLAATVYTVVAAVQLAGAGTLSAEALIVFTAVQGLWIGNSLADIRVRRALAQAGGPVPDKPRDQLKAIAAITDDLGAILDKLFGNVAELKAILARAFPGDEEEPPVTDDSSTRRNEVP